MRKPSKEDFKLKKAKLHRDGGLEVDYVCTYKDDEGEVHGETVNIKKKDRRHPDLDAVADELKQHLLHGQGHLSVVYAFEKMLSTKALKDSFAYVKEALLQAQFEKTKVTTVSLSGEDHQFGVIISGSYKSFQGQSVALNTPRIVFSQDGIGIEKQVEDIIERLTGEVYDFIFDVKKWQSELDFDGKNSEPSESADKSSKKSGSKKKAAA